MKHATHVHGLMADLLAFRKRQAAPFGERAAAFVAGLRALTRQTGVAVTSTAALGAWNQIEMVDAAESPRGQYLRDDTDLEWVRGEGEDPMPYGDRVERHGGASAPPSTTTPERAAWARLVAAHIGAANAARGQSIILGNLAAADVESAEQALRDLGVDAHALILKAIGDPNLFR